MNQIEILEKSIIKNISLIYGGKSRERGCCSKETLNYIKDVIIGRGYNCNLYDLADPYFAEKIIKDKPDFAFNLVPGDYGEDGRLSGFFEVINVPYSHPGWFHHTVSIHKPTAKILFKEHGLNVPKGRIVTRQELLSNEKLLDYPYIIKHTDSGSSMDLFLIKNPSSFFFDEFNCPFINEAMVEEYISGDEYTVTILNGNAIGIVKVMPNNELLNTEIKKKGTKIDAHPKLSSEVYELIKKSCETAYFAVRAQSIARVDLKYNSLENKVYILEINTLPGLTPSSFLTISFKENLNKDLPDIIDLLITDGINYWIRKNKLEKFYKSRGLF